MAFFFGLVFGSFFNVAIYRLPQKISLVKPGSRCPNCGHKLNFLELIPVVSFLLQKGRCKACHEGISWRYPLIELATGLGFALIAWWHPVWTSFLTGAMFYSLLLVLAFIDLDHKILPNAITVPGVLVALFLALLGFSIPFWSSVLGALVGFLLLFAIALISKGGMGMGDLKMMALIGAFLGWKAVFYVLFGASLLGSVGGILYLYLTKQDRKTPIPFGPSLALAAVFVYFLF